MNKPTWTKRLQYKFDNFFAKGTISLIGGLGILSIIFIALLATLISTLNLSPEEDAPIQFIEALWISLMQTLDAGGTAEHAGWGFRVAIFIVTLGGVFIISTLISVLTSGVESKLNELRKGRSLVIESGHILILGWSPQVYTIINELCIANENQKNPCIVILGNKDKVEMEDAIRENVQNVRNTRIVCRSGNPIDMKDIEIVSPQTSKSIIVLSQERENPDARVIKTLLALLNSPNRRKENYHIVTEIRDPQNFSIVKMVGKDEVEIIMVGNLISRIIAQTCRQSGLSIIYTELLDFGGNEIYFKEEPELSGKTFGEALTAYEDSCVIGLMPHDGQPMLNPPMDSILHTGDKIIAITEDDDTIQLSHLTGITLDRDATVPFANQPHPAEKTMILGWNWRGKKLIIEMDHYIPAGSNIHVVSRYKKDANAVNELVPHLNNASLKFTCGNTTDRQTLDNLHINEYNHIILLCYSDHLNIQEADAVTLMSLLHLRDIAKNVQSTFSITSEILDEQNHALAEVTQADDFIISDKLVSLLLAQVSENKYLSGILTDIFNPEDSEIYLKPVIHYVKANTPVNFYTVVDEARRRGEIAIGYRIRSYSKNADKMYGIIMNPKKSDMITFSEQDCIIVVAEE